MAIKAIEKKQKRISFIILSIISIFWLVPIVWVISTSFKTEIEAVSGGLNLIPREFTIESYLFVFADQNNNIINYIGNSFMAASLHTILYLIVASLAAYGYSILRFKHRDKIFWMLIGTMMIPAVMNLIPLYSIMLEFKWIDKLQALIFPGLGGVFGIFLLRRFFLNIPDELIEAAKIDGASHPLIYLRIVLPLAKPVLIVVALFSFMGNWNDYLWPLIVLDSESVRTLPVGLALMQGNYNIFYSRLAAATVISMVPVIVLFMGAQKFFVKGIMMSGVKN